MIWGSIIRNNSSTPRDSKKISRSQKYDLVSPEERREFIDTVFFVGDKQRTRRFWLLLILAAIIATFGLLKDSTAVVIGAMLLSPLTMPLMGVSASMVMGWSRRMAWAVSLVIMATLVSIAIGWLITYASPLVQYLTLPEEVLSRTNPAMSDLWIALAAGIAGGIASVRKDISPALPGVAIAVAVLPPLVTIGIMLGVGDTSAAWQAMLLYITNIAAIVFSASAVFVISGLVPKIKIAKERKRILLGFSVSFLIILLVAIPLRIGLLAAIREGQTTSAANNTIEHWIGKKELRILELNITSDEIEVALAGPDSPPSAKSLDSALEKELNRKIRTTVYWFEGKEESVK